MEGIDSSVGDELRALEERWRPQVAGASLLAELEVTREDIDFALTLIGDLCRRSGVRTALRRLVSSYPAVLAVGFSGAASLHYDAGNFWAPFWERLEINGDANLAGDFGTAFLDCLRTLRLTTFPEIDEERGYRYISRMLLHAGVPITCIDDWVEAIETASRRVGSDDSGVLFDHLTTAARARRLHTTAMPVQRFLRLGGDYALDFLDRSIDVIRGVSGDTSDPTGLPDRFVEEIRRVVTASGVARVGSRPRRRAIARPQLAFDAGGIGVHLVLPATEHESSVNWVVRFDQEQRSIHAPMLSTGLSQTVEVPVPVAVGRITVEGPQLENQIRLDQGGGLLLFGTSGRALPNAGDVLDTEVWVLHPQESALAESGQRVLERTSSVHRWPGWSAVRLDLTEATSIGLVGGPTRRVDHQPLPRLMTEPLDGVMTTDGHAVFDSWPTLALPASPNGWTVTVADESEPPVSRTATFNGAEAEEVDLGQVWPDLGGIVTITVRGPLGRGLKTVGAIAPGASLRTIPSWRGLAEGGLCAATIDLRHPSGRAEAVEVAEGVTEVRGFLELAPRNIPVVIKPPGMGVRVIREGEPTVWSHATLRLSSDELITAAPTLVVHHGGDGQPPLLELSTGVGVSVQQVQPTGARAGGTAAYDLRRFADTVRANPACSLHLRGSGRHDRVAVVRPARLVGDVVARATGDALHLVDPATLDIVVAVYQHLDPVAPPIEARPNEAGVVMLPEDLVAAGDLRVRVRIDDPWSPQSWGAFPRSDSNTFDVSMWQPNLVEGVVPRLIAYGTEPPADPDSLAAAVSVYPLLDRYLTEERAGDIRSVIRSVTRREPEATAIAIAATTASAEDRAHMAVNLGAVSRPLARLDVATVETLLDRWAPLGVAAASHYLKGPDREWMADMIADRVGMGFRGLLDGSDESPLHRPRFEDDHLLDLPDEVLDLVFRSAGIVPAALLDADAQALSGRRLLTAIRDHDPRLAPIRTKWADYVGATLHRLGGMGAPARITSAIQRRVQGDDWQIAPAASLAFATLARLDARRDPDDRQLRNEWRFALGRLARTAPNLVAADLVMTEAVLLSEGV